ncbi:ABC transporter permease [Aquimarina agarilytica]|uniref:ABC transporter permease n=1 Tax=Aquimarina agarilytica TaxID=1087449 RepID=UPI000289E41F|nr:ABC transporter permease [Aquimarina agarilytica]
MFDIERWEEIFEAISKNKLRTFLTGLSVGSGIFILIILLAVADGMKNGTKKQFERDIATKISFWTASTSKEYKGFNINRWISFKNNDYNYVTDQYKDEIEYKTTDFRNWGARAIYKDKNGSYQFRGVMPDMLFVTNATLNAGRFISERDISNNAKVVAIGIRVAKDLFTDYTKAVGEDIKINNIKFKVIGVFTDAGGERANSMLYSPLPIVAQLYNRPRDVGSFDFTLQPEDDYNLALQKSEKFAEQVKTYLQKKHHVHPDDLKAIRFYNAVDGNKDLYMLNLGMKVFFWGIGILTLIAGIVGVSNIMLIIVKERTKEIGIRKALGAQPKSIVKMILHESIFVTSISGGIGLIFALALLALVGPKIETDFILNPNVEFGVAIITVLLLIIAGAVAGYIPARHASKIKPIIALRDE